jgi:antirestriction protein ArdC
MSQALEQKTQNPQKEKIESELNKLVTFFQTADNVPELVAKTYLSGQGKPSDKWSLNNRFIQIICGNTEDARTYNQWLQIGRHVKKGEKSFFILAPNTFLVEKEDKITGQKEKIPILKGFRGIAVFADHQTEGKKIVYVNEPKEKPPLIDVAERMGLKVKFDKTIAGEFGDYDPNTETIRLCTADMGTFFHELAHAVHKRIDGKLKGGQDKDQEIIAEFTSCVIASIYGYDKKGYTFKYIKSYNNGDTAKIGESIIKVMSKVEKILNYIFTQ